MSIPKVEIGRISSAGVFEPFKTSRYYALDVNFLFGGALTQSVSITTTSGTNYCTFYYTYSNSIFLVTAIAVQHTDTTARTGYVMLVGPGSYGIYITPSQSFSASAIYCYSPRLFMTTDCWITFCLNAMAAGKTMTLQVHGLSFSHVPGLRS